MHCGNSKFQTHPHPHPQMLQYSFTTEDKRSFIYARLNLLDQYYCLSIELSLWQSYLEIALQLRTWPVSIFF